MERQRHICVIDWFGVNYDGTMPTILLACEENWFGLFPVAPPNPRPWSLPTGRTDQIVSIDKIAQGIRKNSL